YSALSGSTYRYILPMVSDERCRKCHEDLNGDPIPVGARLGVMEFNFDISDRRGKSFILAYEILIGLSILIVTLVYSIYRMFDKSIISPIRSITSDIAGLEREEFQVSLPEQETEEIDILVKQVGKTATTLEEKKKERERALKEEQEKVAQIRSFVLPQADQLGITDENEITRIITRLSEAVKEVEKNEMLSEISKWVTLESKKLILKNDINLIRPAAFYLAELITCFDGSVRKGSIELALEEAITNAIVHGNLEIQSSLKEDGFDVFDRQIKERCARSPYCDRKVRISYDYGEGKARFKISDEGGGFDWRNFIKKGEADQLELHGRGIIIMRTFANSLEFTEKGDSVTLNFEID
ncbi:MAG: ATP-binding protein, partial [Nitrospinota bacterium]